MKWQLWWPAAWSVWAWPSCSGSCFQDCGGFPRLAFQSHRLIIHQSWQETGKDFTSTVQPLTLPARLHGRGGSAGKSCRGPPSVGLARAAHRFLPSLGLLFRVRHSPQCPAWPSASLVPCTGWVLAHSGVDLGSFIRRQKQPAQKQWSGSSAHHFEKQLVPKFGVSLSLASN